MASTFKFARLLCAMAFLYACGDERAPRIDEERVRALLSEGKAQLARNEWSNAGASFEEVLSKHDPQNGEAHLGAALANTLFVTDALRYLSTVVDRNSVELLPLSSDDESIYIDRLIAEAIQDVSARFAAAEQHLAAAEKDTRFAFRIDSLPLYFSSSNEASFDLAGEWDRADALFLHGVVDILLGILEAAASVDLLFDFPAAHAYLTQPGFDANNLAHFESLVVLLLNDSDYPNFLGLRAEGAERLAQALAYFTAGARNLELALYAASRETDDQNDDVLRYLDGNGNRRFDPPFDQAADACARRAGLEASGETPGLAESFAFLGIRLQSRDAQELLNQRLLCLFQKLQVNAGWGARELLPPTLAAIPERPRINLMLDLLPVLDAGLAGISTAYPEVTFGVPVPEGVLTTVAAEIVGDSFALDPFSFFSADDTGAMVTVRGLFPAWEANVCPETGLCLNAFHIEMECSPLAVSEATFPAPLTTVVASLDNPLPVCRRSWIEAGQAQDSAHFRGEIAADGIISYVPYIQFGDPTFHGLLYLNVGATGLVYEDSKASQNAAIAAGLKALDQDASDFSLANQAELNAMLAALTSNDTVGGVLLDLAEE
jgi:hypothetical protein